MTIEANPSPDGQYVQHTLTGKAESEPADHFTDSVADLERLQADAAYPMAGTLAEVIASTKL